MERGREGGIGRGRWKRRGGEGGGEGREDKGGEKEGLPPLEWRSGYAAGLPVCPAADRYVIVPVCSGYWLELVDGVASFGVAVFIELHHLTS